MFHIWLFLSSLFSSLGYSMCRLAHRVLILFTRRRHPKLTTTLAALPSPLGAAITSPGPSPLLSNDFPIIHKWSGSFLAEEFESYRNMVLLLSRNPTMIIGPLILLALLCASFSSNLGNLSSAFFSWAQSATVRLFSFVRAGCRAKVCVA